MIDNKDKSQQNIEDLSSDFDVNRPKWTNYFKIVEPLEQTALQTDNQSVDGSSLYASNSWYQFVTYGSAARLNRYREYDVMDADGDITRSLDLIAEEMCGNISKNSSPFILEMANDSQMPKNSHYAVALTAALKKWCDIQSFSTRIFPTNRKTIKYGDTFYRKKDSLKKWVPLSPKQVIGAIVNKEDVTEVLGWQIKKNTLNAQGSENLGNYQVVGVDQSEVDTEIVPANEIVRFSVNTELADTAPFGESILQSVYRTFKQKQLLEDAILIYRISRSPERLAFYVDTSGMNPNRVQAYLERVKNDMNQKMIPSPNASGGIESTYNPMCLVLPTLIPLLDGSTKSLALLIEEFNRGKANWAFSVDPETGKTVPGKITWAGVTRKNTQTVTLVLDNGKTFTCTPDHKIPTQNRGFVEAQNLTKDDSLYPFIKQMKEIQNDRPSYEMVYDSEKKGFVFIHRMVANACKNTPFENETCYVIEGEKKTIHHVDFNKFNNCPENLTWMNSQDHIRYHSDMRTSNQSNINRGVKQFHEELRSNPEQYQAWLLEKTNRAKQFLIDNPDKHEMYCGHLRNAFIARQINHPVDKQNNTIKFSDEHFEMLIDVIKSDIMVGFHELIQKLNDHLGFMTLFSECNMVVDNQSIINKVITTQLSQTGFKKLLRNYGYTNLKTLKDKIIGDKLQHYSYGHDLLDLTIQCGLVAGFRANAIIEHFKHDEATISQILNAINKVTGLTRTKLSASLYIETIQKMGYDNFDDFIAKSYYVNHRVTSIIWNDRYEDTGTLTIDGNHELHDYHTFAIDAGIYVKNSQLDNYFFSVRENGKGSRVESVQGGMQLDQLADLEYFEKKMFRGLRIPLSYIKNDAENPAVFNDGKVGLAYIEEIRFNQYTERLQSDQDKVYDTEFKEFVHAIGLNIDPLTYSIKLPPPTNFNTYREMELNAELLNAFSSADGVSSLSKRFSMKKFLNFTETEIAINEQWRRQELGLKQNDPTAFRKIYDSEAAAEDSSAGGGSFRDLDSSFGGHEMSDIGGDLGEDGDKAGGDLDNANDEGNLNAGITTDNRQGTGK